MDLLSDNREVVRNDVSCFIHFLVMYTECIDLLLDLAPIARDVYLLVQQNKLKIYKIVFVMNLLLQSIS